MENGSGKLFEDDGQPAFTRSRVGDDVVIQCRGMIVAAFQQSDELMRDVAIATLVLGGHGLTTDAIAELCGASHGWVCEVRKRYRSGGLEAVLARGASGPPRLLVGRKADRLREMHGAGERLGKIAAALGVSERLVSKEVKRLGLPRSGWGRAQATVPGVGGGAPKKRRAARATGAELAAKGEAPADDGSGAAEAADTDEPSPPSEDGSAAPCNEEERECGDDAAVEPHESDVAEVELGAGVRLAPGTEHPCRYAGTLLVCAAAAAIGVPRALELARVARPATAVYDALQVLLAMMAAWVAGYRSLEAMHERDARALGVILGLQRSPSVRTLHRAVEQMGSAFDAVQLGAGLIRGLLDARRPDRLWFGADGHFKAYAGDAPIDKGWDSKRRLATTGLMDVMITDEHGWTWHVGSTPAGDALSKHLLDRARTLRGVVGDTRPIVMAFDRGGFDFDVLDALDRDRFFYVGYVPASVTLPDLATIAPATGGVGQAPWKHPRLHHHARLVVERDGDVFIPVVTNLPTVVDAVDVINGLRVQRGAQENSFKAARAFAHIDTLVDRGGFTMSPDDRLVRNPVREGLEKDLRRAKANLDDLKNERPSAERTEGILQHDIFWTDLECALLHVATQDAPPKVPRITLEPDAQRATLKTRHRLLLQPLRFAAENARRWLLEALGPTLAPSNHLHDQEAMSRTLLALIRAPGTIHFAEHLVTVTLDFPLPPTAHQRVASALQSLDHRSLRFTDGLRRVAFRLAPRPTRASIYGTTAG